MRSLFDLDEPAMTSVVDDEDGRGGPARLPGDVVAASPMSLSGPEVARLLDRPSLIEALAAAFRGGFDAPQRHHHPVPVPGQPDATMLLMPAWTAGRYLGAKLANVFPGNGARGLPAVQSVYLLFSGATGELLATIDGNELTVRRTVAASSLAARSLARPDASRLLIVGTGAVARQVAASHAAIRPIRTVEVWGRDGSRAETLAQALRREGFEATAASDLREAAARADIITCCTLSAQPLIEGAFLRPGVHLDLIGGFRPDMREADDAAAMRATILVDTAAALAEAGDIVQPLMSGAIGRDAIVGDLADLAIGRHPGRTREDEITLFKSVGAAIEDLAAAMLCFERARGEPRAA